jgi:hypothetical protein
MLKPYAGEAIKSMDCYRTDPSSIECVDVAIGRSNASDWPVIMRA